MMKNKVRHTWQLNESWLELVLQEEKIVRGGNCDDIFCRMPCGMEDLFVEIQAVNENLILFTFTTRAHL